MRHKEQSIAALERLRGLLETNAISQTELAEKIGIRRQTVGQMLNGKFHPTLDNLFRALNAINEIAGTNYGLADLA